MQIIAQVILDDLCFLDGRGDAAEWDLTRFGKRGIVGPFRALFGEGRYADEVASVIAARAFDLGYLDLDQGAPINRLALTDPSIRERFDQLDFTKSEVADLIGPPNLIVGEVHCYLRNPDEGAWVFFDFAPRLNP